MNNRENKGIEIVGRAVIVRDGRVIVIEIDDGRRTWWSFPGGRQEFGETATECVARECREELGCDIRVGKLLLVREFIPDRLQLEAEGIRGRQFLEMYFAAELVSEPDLVPRDGMHRQVAWVSAEKARAMTLYPECITKRLAAFVSGEVETMYVGNAE